MGKYEPLAEYLKHRRLDAWDAPFSDIEDILGFELPASARRHRAWWANSTNGSHSQAKGWIAAGWWVEPAEINLRDECVRFVRAKHAGRMRAGTRLDELRERAIKISGIYDLEALEEAALKALIQREAGKQLIALGGTMPDFTLPERERPTW